MTGRCAHTNTHTNKHTHIERTHYLRHSLRSLGGDNNLIYLGPLPNTMELCCEVCVLYMAFERFDNTSYELVRCKRHTSGIYIRLRTEIATQQYTRVKRSPLCVQAFGQKR